MPRTHRSLQGVDRVSDEARLLILAQLAWYLYGYDIWFEPLPDGRSLSQTWILNQSRLPARTFQDYDHNVDSMSSGVTR